MLPLLSYGATFFNLCPFPDSSALYVHNLFPIGPAVWPHFQVFWIVDPLKNPKCRRACRGANCFYSMSIPRWIHRRVQHLVPICPAVWQLSQIWICDPMKPPKMPPGVLKVELYLAFVHSQTNAQTRPKFGANRCNRLTAFPDFWICDPVTPMNSPWGIEGRIVFSLCPFPDESTDVYQIWCQSVQQFGSFPRRLNLWPTKPPPQCPLCYWGAICI